MCPAKYEGLIRLMKYNPHLEKGKYGRTSCKGMAENFSLLINFLHSSHACVNL
jgi:hypothetical protein